MTLISVAIAQFLCDVTCGKDNGMTDHRSDEDHGKDRDGAGQRASHGASGAGERRLRDV
jgi:hypothetical protein